MLGTYMVGNVSKNEIFIKNCDENSGKGYFFELDVDHPKKLFDLHKDLLFLPKRKKVNKVEKRICKICYNMLCI